MKRRNFIKGISGLAGLTALTGLYTWKIEPFWMEFVHKDMPVKNLPDHLVGKILVQISDIHVSNRFNYQYIIDSFKKAQKLNPDFVAYTGDYVTYESHEQFRQLKEVLPFATKGKLGTVGILGNHDYGKGWRENEVAEEIISILKDSKITILRNEQKDIAGLNFIGLDDLWGANFDPEHATKHYDASKANIALCHNPDVCDMDVWNGYQGWILAGHTHGGQCKPPFLPPPLLPVENSRYSAGEIDLNDGRILYINRALGHLWPIRFNVRPEITVFKLERT